MGRAQKRKRTNLSGLTFFASGSGPGQALRGTTAPEPDRPSPGDEEEEETGDRLPRGERVHAKATWIRQSDSPTVDLSCLGYAWSDSVAASPREIRIPTQSLQEARGNLSRPESRPAPRSRLLGAPLRL